MDKINDLINSGKPVLIDFYADWCGPCKAMAPILKQAKTQLGDTTTIIKVDVDKNQQAASAFQVLGIPTLVLFKNGTEVWRQSGVVPLSELVALLKRYK